MLRPNTIYTPPDTISIKNDKFFLMSVENYNMNNLVSKAWGRAVCQSRGSDTDTRRIVNRIVSIMHRRASGYPEVNNQIMSNRN